jgi:hypothetical protein
MIKINEKIRYDITLKEEGFMTCLYFVKYQVDLTQYNYLGAL